MRSVWWLSWPTDDLCPWGARGAENEQRVVVLRWLFCRRRRRWGRWACWGHHSTVPPPSPRSGSSRGHHQRRPWPICLLVVVVDVVVLVVVVAVVVVVLLAGRYNELPIDSASCCPAAGMSGPPTGQQFNLHAPRGSGRATPTRGLTQYNQIGSYDVISTAGLFVVVLAVPGGERERRGSLSGGSCQHR